MPGSGHAEQPWKIQPKRSGETAMLHRGGCSLCSTRFGFLDREDALIALTEPDIEPCEICNPHTDCTRRSGQRLGQVMSGARSGRSRCQEGCRNRPARLLVA